MKDNWHSLSLDNIYDQLGSSEKGFTKKEAERRLARYGKNEIEEGEEVSAFSIFLEQFKDFLILIIRIGKIHQNMVCLRTITLTEPSNSLALQTISLYSITDNLSILGILRLTFPHIPSHFLAVNQYSKLDIIFLLIIILLLCRVLAAVIKELDLILSLLWLEICDPISSCVFRFLASFSQIKPCCVSVVISEKVLSSYQLR